jgi:hypothetical protein
MMSDAEEAVKLAKEDDIISILTNPKRSKFCVILPSHILIKQKKQIYSWCRKSYKKSCFIRDTGVGYIEFRDKNLANDIARIIGDKFNLFYSGIKT